MTSIGSTLIPRIRSLARAVRRLLDRTPPSLPDDPHGEPPRDAAHDPGAYQSEAAKAPGPATISFH